MHKGLRCRTAVYATNIARAIGDKCFHKETCCYYFKSLIRLALCITDRDTKDLQTNAGAGHNIGAP